MWMQVFIHMTSDASNLLLVLSITFYFHYSLWGCMHSTGPFQFLVIEKIYLLLMLLSSLNRKYPPFPLLSYFPVAVCLRCMLHHVLSLIANTFRENRECVLIIIVQLMTSAVVGYVLACRSHSFVSTLHHLFIIIVQTYLKTLNA